jgi:hypothetical protein
MATLSMLRLEQALASLGKSMDEFIAGQGTNQAALIAILERQRRLDRWQHRAAELEAALAAEIGWPRLVIELDDQDLEFVSMASGIDKLVAAGKVSSADADWLNQELAHQLDRWRVAGGRPWGLRFVRGREQRFAERQGAALLRFIGASHNGIPSVVTRLIVLIATIEPGPTAEALLTITKDLLHIDD